ncbi:MAG: ABC transporter permease subunit [Tissierellia bacterium]|nr:ABC transporter permease subunit [Tissierellia bacterium]
MNLISYEIKSSIKSSIIWTVAIIATFTFLMLGAFPTYSNAKQEIVSLLNNYPPQFLLAFGLNIEKLFSFEGFYNFSYGYIGLMGGIMAVALSISTFGREKMYKATDFLLTKPMSRELIFIRKLLACLAIIISVNIVYIVAGIAVRSVSGDVSYSIGEYILILSGFLFLQLVFLAIGIIIATLSKRIRSVAGTATAVGFTAFILSAISNIFEDKHIEYAAPLKYFEPIYIIDKGIYEPKLIAAAVIVIALCCIISFFIYCRSDVPAS